MSLTWNFTKAERRTHAHILLPLGEASLCVDCETVTDAKGEACPACDSKGGLVSLSVWLGGSVGPVGRRAVVTSPTPQEVLSEVGEPPVDLGEGEGEEP